MYPLCSSHTPERESAPTLAPTGTTTAPWAAPTFCTLISRMFIIRPSRIWRNLVAPGSRAKQICAGDSARVFRRSALTAVLYRARKWRFWPQNMPSRKMCDKQGTQTTWRMYVGLKFFRPNSINPTNRAMIRRAKVGPFAPMIQQKPQLCRFQNKSILSSSVFYRENAQSGTEPNVNLQRIIVATTVGVCLS